MKLIYEDIRELSIRGGIDFSPEGLEERNLPLELTGWGVVDSGEEPYAEYLTWYVVLESPKKETFYYSYLEVAGEGVVVENAKRVVGKVVEITVWSPAGEGE